MMTASETIDFLFKLPKYQGELDFTFDNIDEDPNCDPSDWFGVKLTQIFDEEDFILAMGYYGGGSTEAYDIYGLVDNSDNIEYVKEYCTNKLQNFMNTWNELGGYCEKICVEIERGN